MSSKDELKESLTKLVDHTLTRIDKSDSKAQKKESFLHLVKELLNEQQR